ncbi:MAG: hypothetical protein JW837_04115 [Sedimentisphaerales bacterium]|nr:hypothetical protein [Sedimentisphaerales bacterium]
MNSKCIAGGYSAEMTGQGVVSFLRCDIIRFFLVIFTVLFICSSVQAEWQVGQGPLMTRWAKQVSPKKVHPEYPRPQQVRKSWMSLNGLWQYAIAPKDQNQPAEFDGQILVPFPAESALSGVMKPVGAENQLWYRRTFNIPTQWKGKRVLIHFGAVDWDSTIWVNGTKAGRHKGGYDPFTLDITDMLNETGDQEIVLSVWDPTDSGTQPRGKQVSKPHGIWYTAVTGIWRTVWLEPVPEAHIKSLKIVPDIDNESVSITAVCSQATTDCNVAVEAGGGWLKTIRDEGKVNEEIILKIEKAKLWSPDSPFLYDLKVTLKDSKGRMVDSVNSYFGMRKISLGKDEKDITRLFLNNRPLFHFGPLDQGWWPDGLYTAPTDAALRYDIEVLKKLGCNMLRKHVKVEPDRLYYWCDKLGLMVWQDMPNGDRHIGGNDPDIERTEESAKQFELELTRVINAFGNHPCIVMWVPFNEGWGQYDTERIVNLVRELDPSRLVNNTSGWADRGVGDVHDIHRYPGPASPPVEEKRAAVLGEFGGLGLPVKGHTWQDEKNWGYVSYKSPEELTDAYIVLIDNLRSLIADGLCAGVYTQTTDVEVEVNGLMTYDRAMIKMDAARITAENKRLYLPSPIVKTLVPTSQQRKQNWRYTTVEPRVGWHRAGFSDDKWQTGRGGFGTEGTPGAVIGTDWKTSDIWMRRTFELQGSKIHCPQLLIHHDDDAEIYINSQLVAELTGYTSSYVRFRLAEKFRKTLQPGINSLAVHCHQNKGGQFIDVGLVDVIEKSKK